MFFIRILLITLMFISSAVASDLAREKRMADEIIDAILDGDAVFLNADNHAFLTIYTESEAEDVKGTVIILHGRGFHPDWQDAINPLRVGLTEYGWNTLSIQMPVLEKQAKYYDYVPLFPKAIPRIESAIHYAREQLKDKPDAKIVLAAHSCGAHMAMSWLDVDSIESIDAFIGMGMGATDYKQPMLYKFPLEKLSIPVLDVYAENDYPAVIKMAEERWSMIEKNKRSRQVIVPETNHYYVDHGAELTKIIGEWLQTLD